MAYNGQGAGWALKPGRYSSADDALVTQHLAHVRQLADVVGLVEAEERNLIDDQLAARQLVSAFARQLLVCRFRQAHRDPLAGFRPELLDLRDRRVTCAFLQYRATLKNVAPAGTEIVAQHPQQGPPRM